MSKTREFVEEIDAHFFPEFGGFRTIPYNGMATGVDVIKEVDDMMLRHIVTWDEIKAVNMTGSRFAHTIMEMMNEEWDTQAEIAGRVENMYSNEK